jgi:hypothetical protein
MGTCRVSKYFLKKKVKLYIMFYNVQCSWARAFPKFWPRAFYFGNAIALGCYPTLKTMSLFLSVVGRHIIKHNSSLYSF